MPLPMSRTMTTAHPAPIGFSRGEAKTLAHLQNAEVTHGLVASTRVQMAATVAGIGLQATGMLSREARFQADGDPATANRLNYIVDSFATYVGGEVGRFGF